MVLAGRDRAPWATSCGRWLAQSQNLTTADTARLLAMVYLAGADAEIACQRQELRELLAADHRHPRSRNRRPSSDDAGTDLDTVDRHPWIPGTSRRTHVPGEQLGMQLVGWERSNYLKPTSN